jgi:hypothetical protein
MIHRNDRFIHSLRRRGVSARRDKKGFGRKIDYCTKNTLLEYVQVLDCVQYCTCTSYESSTVVLYWHAPSIER